jgi:RHS repeat-associated protein
MAYTVNGTTEAGEVRYRAFGSTRFTSGTTPTSYRYTGQREEAGLGLYYYGARWYDPALGHFVQPDTLVPEPGNVLDYHRYGYVRFNPLKYNDPTGHQASCTVDQDGNWHCGPTNVDTVTLDLDTVLPNCETSSCNAPGALFLLSESLQQGAKQYLLPLVFSPHPLASQGERTLSVDVSVFAAPTGVVGRGGVSLAVDHEGTFALLLSGGTGGSTPVVVAPGVGFSYSNASSVEKLAGDAIQLGGSVGEGAGVFGEMVLFKDNTSGNVFHGGSVGIGVTLPDLLPGSVHATWERSHIQFQGNPFDIVFDAVQRFWFGRDK